MAVGRITRIPGGFLVVLPGRPGILQEYMGECKELFIRTTCGILSGPSTLYGLSNWITCLILALEKNLGQHSGVGYTWLGGTCDVVSGGGKKESARATTLVMLSSTRSRQPLEVMCKDGIWALEKLVFEGPVHQTRPNCSPVFFDVVVALVCVHSWLQFLKLYIYFEPTKVSSHWL
jgi:hypothetical protein